MSSTPSTLREILIRLGDDIWQKTRVKEKEIEYLSMINGCITYDNELSKFIDKYTSDEKEPDEMPVLYDKIVESNGYVRLSIDSGSRKEMFGLGSIEAMSNVSTPQIPFTQPQEEEKPKKKHFWSRR